jgi:hypothetical protein
MDGHHEAPESLLERHARELARGLRPGECVRVVVDGVPVTVTVGDAGARDPPPLNAVSRDILAYLLAIHPRRVKQEDLHEELDRAGMIHGLSTVKLALSRLRNALGLIVNDLDRHGYGLTYAGRRVAEALRAEVRPSPASSGLFNPPPKS